MSVSLYGSGQTVVQLQTTTKTNSFTTSAGTTWTDITGLSVTITPNNSSNKIKLTKIKILLVVDCGVIDRVKPVSTRELLVVEELAV